MNSSVGAHVKRYALKVSGKIRAGKFKRCSPSFVEEVEVSLETVLRSIKGIVVPCTSDIPVPPCNEKILTGEFKEKICEAVEELAVRLVQKKVHFHPSVGQTLHGKY